MVGFGVEVRRRAPRASCRLLNECVVQFQGEAKKIVEVDDASRAGSGPARF